MKNMYLPLLIAYLLSSIASFGVFAFVGTDERGGLLNPTSVVEQAVPTPDPSNRLVIAPEAPKTAECPLNGKMYTEVEKESWDKRRPLAVMIENHPDARPQSGLIKADVVYEAVVEGGVTRFMGMYYCDAQARDVLVAPVRSARQAFIDWASDYNMPLYVHVGGANGDDTDPRVRALEHLSDYGWTLRNDLNQFSIGYPTFVRNYSRIPGKDDLATEHTMESSTERLWALGDKRGYTNMSPETKVKGKTIPGTEWTDTFTPWTFKDEADASTRGTTTKISHEFWTGYSSWAVEWNYDKDSNTYKRIMGGEPHNDLETGKQIAPKNVVVMFAKELTSVDIHHHNYFQTIGNGRAIVFQNGQAIEANWSKKTRESRLVFTDAKGKEIEFARGMIWISTVDIGTEVTF